MTPSATETHTGRNEAKGGYTYDADCQRGLNTLVTMGIFCVITFSLLFHQ